MTGTSSSRITEAILDDLDYFILSTAGAWMNSSLVKPNSYGVVIVVAPQPGGDFENAAEHEFGQDKPHAKHDSAWYKNNAGRKCLVCQESGLDSHEAVRLWQGTLTALEGAFPWGGAVIDPHYGLVVGTSGFKEDEDILFSRTVRNRLVMSMDRRGERVLADARARGAQAGEAGADRFTRPPREAVIST